MEVMAPMANDDRRQRSRIGSKWQLPNGRWRVKIQRGTRADGSARVVTETVDTEADADRRISELAVELGADPHLARGVTLADVWALYVPTKGSRLARKTVAGYTWYMERVWLPVLGGADVTSISCRDVQDVLLTMGRDKADRSRRILSSVLTFAANEGIIAANPLRGHSFELRGDTGSRWEDESVWDDDPFAAIEGGRDVWDARTVLAALPLMRGLPLEPAWLSMVGGGLRVEEALALRRMDVRRSAIAGRMVTQLAVHHARTDLEERKRPKTARSTRIVAVMEPFGTRLLEIAEATDGRESLLCDVSASNQNKRWRGYFERPLDPGSEDPDERRRARHVPGAQWTHKGRLHGLPYVPLARMRATHSTLMQEAGVLDSVNAAVHGHSEAVAYSNYQRADGAGAAAQTERYLRLVM